MKGAWLQAQIQLHFLFNTIKSIAPISEIDTNQMVDLLDEFGNDVRKIFDKKSAPKLISLERVLPFIFIY